MNRLLLALFLVIYPPFLNAEPFSPSPADMAIIEEGVAEQLLDPSSAIISDVIAISDLTSTPHMDWVCGNVRGKNSFGGYAQDTPFIGTIVNSPTHGRSFVLITIASSHPASQKAVLESCLEKMEGPVTRPDVDQQMVDMLIKQERELNSRCRGSEGADENSTVCEDRNDIAKELEKAGWCYGRDGEAGYQMDWHPCSE